jgi:hypothetical protein
MRGGTLVKREGGGQAGGGGFERRETSFWSGKSPLCTCLFFGQTNEYKAVGVTGAGVRVQQSTRSRPKQGRGLPLDDGPARIVRVKRPLLAAREQWTFSASLVADERLPTNVGTTRTTPERWAKLRCGTAGPVRVEGAEDLALAGGNGRPA